MFRSRRFVLPLAVLLLAASGAAAQWRPKEMVRITVSSPNGGSESIALAVIKRKLDAEGIRHVIEYMPGNDGMLGTQGFKNRGLPDGHHLLAYGLGQYAISHVFHPPEIRGYTWDDFVPISIMARSAVAIVARPKGSATLTEVIAAVRSSSKTFGGIGPMPRFVMEKIARDLGLPKGNLIFVPYRSSVAEMLTQVESGELDFVIAELSPTVPFYRDGRLKILAVSSEARLPGFPEIATFSETIPGFVIPLSWGLVTKKGVTDEMVGFWAKSVREAVLTDDAQAYLSTQFLSVDGASLGPGVYLKHMRETRRTIGLP